MTNNGHENADNSFNINILFILSTYKVVIEVEKNYQLDLRNLGILLVLIKKLLLL